MILELVARGNAFASRIHMITTFEADCSILVPRGWRSFITFFFTVGYGRTKAGSIAGTGQFWQHDCLLPLHG